MFVCLAGCVLVFQRTVFNIMCSQSTVCIHWKNALSKHIIISSSVYVSIRLFTHPSIQVLTIARLTLHSRLQYMKQLNALPRHVLSSQPSAPAPGRCTSPLLWRTVERPADGQTRATTSWADDGSGEPSAAWDLRSSALNTGLQRMAVR